MTTQTNSDAVLKLHDRLASIGGCSNGGCYIVRPKGMHTNGACHCLENRLTAIRVVSAYKEYVRAIEGTNAGI